MGTLGSERERVTNIVYDEINLKSYSKKEIQKAVENFNKFFVEPLQIKLKKESGFFKSKSSWENKSASNINEIVNQYLTKLLPFRQSTRTRKFFDERDFSVEQNRIKKVGVRTATREALIDFLNQKLTEENQYGTSLRTI